MKLGDWRSPLDYVREVILSNPDWEIKKEVYSPAPITGTDRLDELWIQAMNTTSGQYLAMQFKYTYGSSLAIAVSRDTDLNMPWDEQPEAPKTSLTREGGYCSYDFMQLWGRSLDPVYTVIVINRDHIHLVWQGSHYSSGGPYQFNFWYSALSKAYNYLDGVAWATNLKSGYNYIGIHYNEHWYQESYGEANSIEGLQGRYNDLANSTMFEKNYTVHGMYVSPVSIHCNTGITGADTALELAGFLPAGIYGANYYSFPTLLTREHIKYKDYISMPSTGHVPYVNALLYPLS